MRSRRMPLLLLLLLAATLAAGLLLGSTPLSFAALLSGDGPARVILTQVRLPRVLAGVLAGVGLSTAGVLLQCVTLNDLASPNIIGVNSGAGLAVLLVLTFFPAVGALLPLGAFIGAFAAAMVILLLARRLGSARTSVVLIGVAITTLLSAGISFLSLLDEGVLAQYSHFSVGSLQSLHLDGLVLPGIIIALAFAGAVALSNQLSLLSLGDEAASALGVRVQRVRILAMALAAACSAAVVSFAGLLGFVGLVVPHIARALVGQRPRRMLPIAALTGAILVVLADLMGRVLFAPSELPVGILMSLIGAPYFLILLCRRNRHAQPD